MKKKLKICLKDENNEICENYDIEKDKVDVMIRNMARQLEELHKKKQ